MQTEASFIGRPDCSRRPDWATRFSHFGHVENLFTNLVAGSDLVAHLVAGASGRRSGRGTCGHLEYVNVLYSRGFKYVNFLGILEMEEVRSKWVWRSLIALLVKCLQSAVRLSTRVHHNSYVSGREVASLQILWLER